MPQKINKEDFNFLGEEFQRRLLLELTTDRKFALSIMDIINPNYFDDQFLRKICATIKNAYEKTEIIPDVGSLKIRLLDEVTDEIQKGFIIEELDNLAKLPLNDSKYIQSTALKFCKRQELKKALKIMNNIVNDEPLDEYDKCEDILKGALELGAIGDEDIDVFNDIDGVLSDDYRNPIPTGISGLDEVMDGGLSKGELAIILAAFGVGKTTMITKIANTAKKLGCNVLQIFFEDNPKVIQRKHYSCWTDIPLNELNIRKDEVKDLINTEKEGGGILKLKKFPSAGTTMSKIRQYIRKKMAQGFKPDIVLIDYIDCVVPSVRHEKSYEGEGEVMREFETMLFDLDIAGWTAVQGNRSAIKSDIVESDQMGGSIKKGQIGHFMVSISKSLEQKEGGTANMAILKSRFGKDGVIFEDIIFDNKNVQIDMSEGSKGKTYSERQESVENGQQTRVNNLMMKNAQERANTMESNNEN